jgi:hypothetical protein
MPVTRHGRQPKSSGGGATKAEVRKHFADPTIAELEERILAALNDL